MTWAPDLTVTDCRITVSVDDLKAALRLAARIGRDTPRKPKDLDAMWAKVDHHLDDAIAKLRDRA